MGSCRAYKLRESILSPTLDAERAGLIDGLIAIRLISVCLPKLNALLGVETDAMSPVFLGDETFQVD